MVRKFIPDVTPLAFFRALEDTIGGIENGDVEIETVLQRFRNPFAGNGIDCMSFAVSKGKL